MSQRLYDKIKGYNATCKARFCMPAHGGLPIDPLFSSAIFDWTEVQGLDNLLYSDGAIADCEGRLAKRYGYFGALMLTSGSTCGMQIATAFAKSKQGVAVAIGDMHKSFYASARILDVRIFCCKDLQEAEKLSGQIKISCIFVTSPDYFGKVLSLKEIKEFALRVGAYLVVDEAHSAHYPYSSLLPDNASKYADISLVSMHKTLPVYGGGAALFANCEDIYRECILLRADIHTTSPSYLVMASMDYADDLMSRNGEELYSRVRLAVDDFKSRLKVGKVVAADDFSRLVVKIDDVDCDRVSSCLAERGIFIEMSYGDLLVLIVTPFNCDRLRLFASELESIPLEKLQGDIDVDLGMEHIERDGEVMLVAPSNSLDKVCAVDVGIYPPGVPLIKKGDVINQKAIEFIKKYSSRLFGLACGMIPVIK